MKKIIFILFLIYNLTFAIYNCSSQWVYQSLPSYYDVADIKFFDANTGLIVLGLNTQGMLKTTNGGNNWNMVHPTSYFYQLEKIDSSTIYTIGYIGGQYWLYKTLNKASTWDSVLLPYTYRGFSFVNKDTGWISGANQLLGHAIFRTTNGGLTLTQMTDATGWGNLFFLKQKISNEYIGWHYSSTGDDLFWKTTNSGVNWFQATRPPAQYPVYFEFFDENTGWFTWYASTSGGIYRTTNGGMNWATQYVPSGNGIHNTFTVFDIINVDTLYGGGGYRLLSGGIQHGLVWKTTNGGVNWGYQEPDTSIHVGTLNSINFINSDIGWLFGGNGVHTTNGGGPITFTAISNNTQIIAKDYILFQNYPNPFNSISKIKYQISKSAKIKIIISDITGKEISTPFNRKMVSGIYEYNFNAGNLSSGIYFYSMYADNIRVDTKKMVLVK